MSPSSTDPLIRLLLARQHAEEGGFAGAVAADDADDGAARDAAIEILDQQSVSEAFAHMLHVDDLVAQAFSGRYVELGGFVAGLKFLRGKLLKTLQARLALGLSAFGVGADPVQFRFHGALTGLLLRRLLLQTIFFVFQPGAVIAFEGNTAATVQLQNPAGHVVEEISVVGDRDHRTRILGEETLQPGHAFGVQVVRRLIQQQHVRVRQQQCAKRYPAPLTARQLSHFGVPRRQAQRVGGNFQLPIRVPAVGRVDLRLQLALTFDQLVHLVVAHGLGEPVGYGVELAELRHGFTEALLNGAAHVQAVVQLRLLREIADLHAFLWPGFALEFPVFAGHDAQQ